jgi:hypothetical protein
MNDADIKGFFVQQSEREYGGLETKINSLERKVQSIRKGTKGPEPGVLGDQFAKVAKEIEEARKRDFFSSPAGETVKKRMLALEIGLRTAGRKTPEEATSIPMRRAQDYQGRTWITRKNPFVDRMASAWLIRRFIDGKASFKFIDEREIPNSGSNAATFDVRGGEFTHVGDLCTFEVLVRSFAIKDKAVKKIAEIVHDLDVKDEKYGKPETTGVEDILSGLRKTAKNDTDGLERGIAVFEMLYQSKS